MTVYIDENISPYLAKALDVLEEREKKNGQLEVKSLQETFGKSIKDPELIPELGKQNSIWITRDKRILQRGIELHLILDNNVGVIILRPGKFAKHWDMVMIIMKAWPEIRELAKENKPFAYRLFQNSKLEKVDRIRAK